MSELIFDFEINKKISESSDMITTEEFVAIILRGIQKDSDQSGEEQEPKYMEYAFEKGLITDLDIQNKSDLIERRNAARIVHEVLLNLLNEKDEKEWSAAESLKDLYDCRTCVMHISQVYVKGIMPPKSRQLFDVQGKMTFEEGVETVVRMLHKERRVPQLKTMKSRIIDLLPYKAFEIMNKDRTAILLDVRTCEEYGQYHIAGAVSLPLDELINNPFSVCANKDTIIIIYCQKGYKSNLAARVLCSAGYSGIYTILGIEEYDYDLDYDLT